MDIIVAPTYATLVMGYLEIHFYKKSKNEFGVNNGIYTQKNCGRALDDFYVTLDTANINPLKLFDILNNIHDNIIFTVEQYNLYLPFHDIILKTDRETNNI